MRIQTSGGSPKRYQIYSKSGQLLYSKNTADGSETDYIYLNGSLIARSGGGSGGEGLDPPAPMQANPNPTVNRAYVVSWGTVNGAARDWGQVYNRTIGCDRLVRWLDRFDWNSRVRCITWRRAVIVVMGLGVRSSSYGLVRPWGQVYNRTIGCDRLVRWPDRFDWNLRVRCTT